MEILHLQYFTAVARYKSFSKAAAECHISQSVISKLVKDLEQELGVVLFNRTTKNVSLTDEGAIFLEEADKVVTLFNNLTGHLGNRFKLPKGKVIIGLPPLTEAALFARLLGEFRKNYPDIEMELYEHGSKKIQLAIQDGIMDIGVICRLPGNSKIFDSFSYSHDPLKVVVHPSHPLAEAKEISLSALANESFILSNNEFSLHDEMIKKCNQAGFHPKIVLETSQREMMIQAVAVNLGIALMPQINCQRLSKKLVRTISLVNPEFFSIMSVIWKKGRPLSYPAKLFLEFAQKYYAADHKKYHAKIRVSNH